MRHKCKTHRRGDLLSYRYVHWKLDGIWLTIQKSFTGRITYLSSKPTDLTAQLTPLITTPAILERVPPGVELYGELHYPGRPASYVKSAIKQKDPGLEFVGFASSEDPALPLEEVRRRFIYWGVPFVPYQHMRDCSVHLLDYPLPEYRGFPIEGYVFKDGNRLNWAKWKPVKTVDLIVHSTTDGKGKFFGLTGSLVCRTTEGHIIANVSGMDDLTRYRISENEKGVIGRVVEIAYQYVGSKGRLRHPRFVRFRDDKNIDECTVNQDPSLEDYYS